ncbi:MAG TPA: alpha-L-arabinofuranosidase C-terminal domain-containing protein [Bryobacteraceae bacterium]|nr:alpha-L-arabinofuranosidase C-terminal domain-containing protein [Bryobacteraceae bacterium]
MRRRDFLTSAAAAGLALYPRVSAFGQNADSLVEVFVDEPIGTISRNIYGHFTEHIGGVIYDGVWVGKDSKVPNIGGIRKALVEALRRIKAPVIRWPGGCFADSYDWRDGIGPTDRRPTRTNFWEVDPDARRLHEKGVQLFDTNAFGTNEFMQFCKLSQAEPYVAGNVRSLTALDFDHWVAYCNSPAGSTTFANMREADGAREPFNVRFWGVGNESWGCGGNFKPEDYASEFRRFTTWVPLFGQDLYFVGAGPADNDLDWTRRFFDQIFSGPHAYRNPHFRGWSVHHYSHAPHGDALHFGREDWYALLRSGYEMEQILVDQWAVMGEYDREHRVKLVVDEYGSWHPEGTEIDPTHIFGEQITIRDALLTALTLDCFNRHAEKVDMANCAQLVNNLNALFLAHEEKFWATPNFYVFEMYAAHQDAQAVRAAFAAPRIPPSVTGFSKGFWGLKGSASLKGKSLTITAVNPSTDTPREARVRVRGANVSSAKATVLSSDDIHAHNTYEQQDAVVPKQAQIRLEGQVLWFTFPAASVTKLEVELV